jgi:tetratricopeptide (TPR) repeat protein
MMSLAADITADRSAESWAASLPRRPYPGLRPFEPQEDPIFFGREPIIDEIIDLLARRCLVLVHGSSGSGKSSLVLAGVLPRLARQHRRHGWQWHTASMRPGGGPLWNLARALAELESPTPSPARIDALRLSFDRTGANLAEIVTNLAGMQQQRLCILVDQFEELFRFARDTSREEARLFVDLITTTLKEDSESPVRVILTMRSEFLGECARLPGIAGVVNTAQYLLPRMGTASLQRAIRRPAELYDGEVTIDLANRLIADVRGSQDELPLIQHGLMRMWDLAGEPAGDTKAPRRLDLPLYEKHGPLARLLDRHAEVVCDAVAPDESGRRAVEDVFRALTDINANAQAIRRPQTLQSLVAVTGAGRDKVVSILDAFRSDSVSFMTPYAPAPLGDEIPIDISHEALIRCWNSLAAEPNGWLHREFRDGLIWRSLLSQAELFEHDQRKVLGPATTEDRERWLKDRTLAWSERYGGGWSRVERLMTASRKAADWQRRRDRLQRRRERLMTGVLAALVAISLAAAWWASKERDRKHEALAIISGIGNTLVFGLAQELVVRGLPIDLLPQILEPAIEAYKQAIRRDPKNAAAYANLGSAYAIERDYDRAIQNFDKAIQLDPKNALVYRNRGTAYDNKGDYDRAIQDFDQAIQLDPKDTDAYTSRGSAYGVKRDYDRAIPDYNQAIRLDPTNALAYRNRGVTYDNKGDYDRALQNFDQAIKLDPKSAVAYASRGATHDNNGDYDRAIQDFDQAIQLDPKSALAYANRGHADFHQGNFKAGAATLLRANELEDNAYTMIWLYLARERGGENGAAELKANAARLKSKDWPYPVIELYLGARSPSEVLSLPGKPEERCAAQFYTGEWHLLHGNSAAAASALQAAADTCPKEFFEYAGAVTELKRLDVGVKGSGSAPEPAVGDVGRK